MSGASTATLRILPREMRMMTERVLSLTSLPKGFVLAETDIVMYSQHLGLGGFAMLEDRFDLLASADAAAISIMSEDGSRLEIDGNGQHAWVVVPTLLDLCGELVARFGKADIGVVNVIDPQELAIAADLGCRRGLAVDGNPARLTASSQTLTGRLADDEPLLWDLLHNGAVIDAGLWWTVYEHAQKALTPDSVVSRRHAGPLIVTDDGTVIGRRDNDDETDISFLASIGETKETERPNS